jgi:dihydroorotate dehydrogenase (fumarate)
MERTAIHLGGVALNSSVMNASGPHSAEKGEIFELTARHHGAIVFKSCNIGGLESPENLKNRGVEHFATIARQLAPRGKLIIASVVGNSVEEIVEVAATLDRAGASIIELNLADDYVQNSVAPFSSLERLRDLIGRVAQEVSVAALAVKVPPRLSLEPHAVADTFKALGVKIAVCANDLPKDLEVDLKSGTIQGAARPLSQVQTFYRVGDGAVDIVAVGGINSGRDAYIAHLTGAKAVQVGSALIKEGAGALGRIDRELDALLAQHGKSSVADIIGTVRFLS